MSHTADIETQFKISEFNILKKAFEKLGWKIVENQGVRSYYGQEKRTFQYVAVNPSLDENAYDVGISAGKDNFSLHTDYYGGSVAKTLGAEMGLLKQEYAFAIAEDEYAWTGQVDRTMDSNGDILVDITINQ
jgi:hypothetical protein